MKILGWVAMMVLCIAPVTMVAQADEEKELTREVIRAKKKLMVSQNIKLTKAEASGFWPVYEEFQDRLRRLNDRTEKVIETYMQNYQNMSDKMGKGLLDQALSIDEARANLKKLYYLKFKEVLPAKKLVKYYQLESKLEAIIRYELAAQIPLVKVN